MKLHQLPIAENYKHTSPFGIMDGKQTCINLVQKNKEKFLGYSFDIHDEMYEKDRACVRYTARQGENFKLDVSEWYYREDDLIKEIVAYYHIGEIGEERKIENYEG